jgi:hypothetical protein
VLTPRSRWKRCKRALFAATLLLLALRSAASHAAAPQDPVPGDGVEARAVAYLSAEVPRWRREHSCYSCHNNGDATRALIAAAVHGYRVAPAIEDTVAWLQQPERWDANELRGSEDLPLARIQFASALTATTALRAPSPGALGAAAAKVITHQQPDGSWRLSDTQLLGGATFYGTPLATAMARSSVARSDSALRGESLARADSWLRTAPVAIVLDASAVLLGLGDASDPAANRQRGRALAVLQRGQAPDGGWGPYVTSQAEPFDTALALLALAPLRDAGAISPWSPEDIRSAITRGRAYLASTQSEDGSWPETTRPSGGESYAQRISTSAWALLALLASR